MKICLVGGAVRDQLLGIRVTDRDWVVVGATPEQMLELGYQQVGKDFPVFLHPTSKEEYALARKEQKQGVGYHGFVCDANREVTLEADLMRRDLTINAMAMCDGELVDPYGGQRDLAQRCLRHVSDAFKEDPLRVLRVARFKAKLAGLGFELAAETELMMQEMVASGELTQLTPERVWSETAKALATKNPEVYFQTLHHLGALAVLMPELDSLFNIPQDPIHHPEGDAGTHSLMVLAAMRKKTNEVALLWAAVCHDLGKALTPKNYWPNHPGHEQAGVKLVEALSQRYRVPAYAKQLATLVCRWHGVVHKANELSAEDRLSLIQACDAWRKPNLFLALLDVCEADAKGRLGFETIDYKQKEQWMLWYQCALNVSVQSIMDKGYQGEAIKEALFLARVRSIQALDDKFMKCLS